MFANLGDDTALWLADHGVVVVTSFLLGTTTLIILIAFLMYAGRQAGPRL